MSRIQMPAVAEYIAALRDVDVADGVIHVCRDMLQAAEQRCIQGEQARIALLDEYDQLWRAIDQAANLDSPCAFENLILVTMPDLFAAWRPDLPLLLQFVPLLRIDALKWARNYQRNSAAYGPDAATQAAVNEFSAILNATNTPYAAKVTRELARAIWSRICSATTDCTAPLTEDLLFCE